MIITHYFFYKYNTVECFAGVTYYLDGDKQANTPTPQLLMQTQQDTWNHSFVFNRLYYLLVTYRMGGF